ncbi:XRE family transcriptional regulator [Flavobacterium sp. F339]|uniref:XRE family transcriptional regulator n=2 Tax=Flavobacterium turcicum TaxID=2764718 RepID=A0ABR7JEZ8_9FLAO|nr:XRE family transcriptional regulator [Flavobacterium turcicum]NHL01573.1 XRE family transcriptional regulator [Flavobacterium turcicum]
MYWIKEIKESKKMIEQDLSLLFGENITFISQIEAPSKKAKYNIIHLNLISKALNCSPKDFLPEQPL